MKSRKSDDGSDTPSIKITLKAWRKILLFAQETNVEVAGLGTVQMRGNKPVIDDVMVFKHENRSAAAADLDPQDIADEFSRLVEAKQDTGKYRLCWHSHVNMEASFSGTDRACMNSLADLSEWFLWIVVNKSGDYSAMVTVYSPIRHFAEAKLDVLFDEFDKSLIAGVKQEMQEKLFRHPGKGEEASEAPAVEGLIEASKTGVQQVLEGP
jgi:proteasome lid subunit RPN8/RPN11